MPKTQYRDKPLRSLRQRYLTIAGVAALVVVVAAVLSNQYTLEVTDKNTRSLVYRDQVTTMIANIRNAVWRSDTALNVILISPSEIQVKRIEDNLEQAKQELTTLVAHPVIDQANLSLRMQLLGQHLEDLAADIMTLIEKRQDPNWVYPALPYIAQKLLDPNIEFETAAEQALHEIAQRDGAPYASPLYGAFDEVRDLWRRKILNFRAVLIRFAGLGDMDTSAQEQNVKSLHESIRQRLKNLERLADDGQLGFESELALERMIAASETWQRNWHTVKEYRSSSVWRQDLEYLQKIIRPAQLTVFDLLTDIEHSILNWSTQNVDDVQEATHRVSNLLLLFAVLTLGFVVAVYFLIDQSVLKPIAYIANAISHEGQIVQYDPGGQSSEEIHTLVTSFNSMRRQIHQRQLALEHQALHDSLTGLANRNLLQDRLVQAMNIMHRNDEELALLLLDLDRFKEINDTLGHQVGDKLLQEISARLQGALRESDTVARLGGDEFAIVAPNTDINQSRIFAEKIADTLTDVFKIEHRNLYVGVSIGVAIYPRHGEDAQTLVRHADIAMYIAKRNNMDFKIYEPSEDERPVDQLALVGELHDELKTPENLALHYQPQIDLLTQRVTATEALLRWNHPQMGAISPEHIINIAEHTGLIGSLTKWVVNTAVADCMRFREIDDSFQLSINLSAWNLQDPELPDVIENVLIEHHMPADKLIFEITESAMMYDPIHARTILHRLTEMGIKLAIDDFGTGFSSLGYLKMLPVSSLKIDKSFVVDMLHDENDAIIVSSTVALAHNLRLDVVAEGVEDQETLNRLRSLRCDTAQGNHIAQPMAREQLYQWLKNYQRKQAL